MVQQLKSLVSPTSTSKGFDFAKNKSAPIHPVKAAITIQKNRLYYNNVAGLHVDKLCCELLEVSNCDFYGNNMDNILMRKVSSGRQQVFLPTE